MEYQESPCDTNTGGGGNSIPYCDERTCTNSCIQFMQYNRGKCLKNECYCEKISKEPTKPKPVLVEDWNYISQDGKIMKFFDKRYLFCGVFFMSWEKIHYFFFRLGPKISSMWSSKSKSN